MSVKQRIVPNLYKDSVALMAISSKLLALDGLDEASVVMATPTNLENLTQAGLGEGLDTKPSDLIVAVRGYDEHRFVTQPTSEHPQDVEARFVRPMEILEDEDQR